MKRQLSNTMYGLKFAVEKKGFDRPKSSSGKERKPPGCIESTVKSAFTWRKRFRAMVAFDAYLKRSKKRDDESCRYCGSLVENAEHTFFVCARWGAKRALITLRAYTQKIKR